MKKCNFTLLLICVLFFINNPILAKTTVTLGEDINGDRVVIYGEVSEISVPNNISREPAIIKKILNRPNETYRNETCDNKRVWLIKYRQICSWQEYKYIIDHSEIAEVRTGKYKTEPVYSVILIITEVTIVALLIYLNWLIHLFRTNKYKTLSESSKMLVVVNVLLLLVATTPFMHGLNTNNRFLVLGFIIIIASTILTIVNNEVKKSGKGMSLTFLLLAGLASLFFLVGSFSHTLVLNF